jgi:dTMP kinase
MSHYESPFITIEGIDGAGKDTVLEAVRDAYPDAVYTKEPDDDTLYGEYVREVIADETAPPLTVFFAFLADHAAHVEHTVRPALEAGSPVFCNRYIDSRYAYQASELDGVVADPLGFIDSIQTEGWAIFPDLTLLIDITPEEAMKRIGSRGESRDRFEKLDGLAAKQEIYATLAEQNPDRFVLIDGMQSDDVEENKRLVAADCLDAIDSVMN